jgi:hypothetical protein
MQVSPGLGDARTRIIPESRKPGGVTPHSMFELRYEKMTAMDLNHKWHTGIGYLQSHCDHTIHVVNSLDECNQFGGSFGAILSSGTVRH